MLKTELDSYLNFQVPDGGMAVWTQFDRSIDLEILSKRALEKGLFFSHGKQHDAALNATRLGFASSTEQELEQCIEVLKSSIK